MPAAGLDHAADAGFILGWGGALDEGENQASDGRRDGRGTASEKFYWRPVAPTEKGSVGIDYSSPFSFMRQKKGS
jgi:hypothetical protein